MIQDNRIHARIGNLVSLVTQPEFWGELVSTLKDYVFFDTWCILHYKNGKPHVLSQFDDWDDGSFFQKYLTSHYQYDPFYLTQSSLKANEWTSLKDVSDSNYYSSTYFKEYLSKFCNDEMSLRIDLKNNTLLEFSIGKHDDFNEQDFEALLIFQPWFVSLIQWRMWYEMTGSLIPQQSFNRALLKFKEHVSSTGILSPRESEVAFLLCQSANSSEISKVMNISADTVRIHVRSVLAKTKTKTSHELFNYMLSL